MARTKSKVTAVMPEDNEVDAFHSNQEKILLQEAGEYGKANDYEEDSDEEVLKVHDEDEDEDEADDSEFDEEGEDEDEDEEDIEGWGGRKNYYGGDEIEDSESAKHMTEEAIRQQKKHLQDLGMEDYVDDDMMEDWSNKAESFDNLANKKITINDDVNLEKLDKSEKLELLNSSFPEFIPLLKELNVNKPKLDTLGNDEISNLKKIALTAYLSAISSYFSIFSDQIKHNEPFSSMKEHPVMESILTTRQIWKEVEGLRDETNDDDDDDDDDEEEFVDAEELEVDAEGMEDEAESESDDDMDDDSEDSDAEVQPPQEDPEDINIDISTKRTIKSSKSKPVDDFTEPISLDEIDEEEKQRKKKSLRFYTAKIDKAVKQDENSGDLDLPYKERLFERKQRLIEEARQRGLKENPANDLDDEDINGDDKDIIDDVNQNTEYYNMMKHSKLESKEQRKLAHKQAVKLSKEGKLKENQELIGEHGKRALNFQIMKNKGLTAKKRKEVRNARVKKRKKHEKAQKKLKSVRSVYEGSKGPYEGEKTGIKKGLSRSVKLG